MNFLPFFGKKDEKMKTENLPAVREDREILPVVTEKNEADHGDIVILQKSTSLTKRPTNGLVQFRTKEITIAGKKHKLDPQMLIRMIRQVTQTIGSYKKMVNPTADYVVDGLRETRARMVSDLEAHFSIHWQINDDGACEFWV